MSAKHPSEFFPDLREERLVYIAQLLLDTRNQVIDHTNLDWDCSYTRGTRVFGCSRNRLLQEAASGKHDWLSPCHAGMDFTLKIGQIPVRYFQDDPDQPEKNGFFKRNATDNLFEPDDQMPVMWRFVVEVAVSDLDEDKVFFIGYNSMQEEICRWTYQSQARMLHVLGGEIPPSTNIGSAEVGLAEDSASEDSAPKSGKGS